MNADVPSTAAAAVGVDKARHAASPCVDRSKACNPFYGRGSCSNVDNFPELTTLFDGARAGYDRLATFTQRTRSPSVDSESDLVAAADPELDSTSWQDDLVRFNAVWWGGGDCVPPCCVASSKCAVAAFGQPDRHDFLLSRTQATLTHTTTHARYVGTCELLGMQLW